MHDALRTNGDWVAALTGESVVAETAVSDLQSILRRALVRVVRSAKGVDLDDLMQESLARVLAHIGSFRGDSRFTTWACGIAVRVAFTELRRRTARASKTFDEVEAEVAALARSREARPEANVDRTVLFDVLEEAIQTRLTDRQRVAVLAELRGVPTIEIAERLGTNQNALYKLVHDARRTLKRALVESGFDRDAIHDTFKETRS